MPLLNVKIPLEFQNSRRLDVAVLKGIEKRNGYKIKQKDILIKKKNTIFKIVGDIQIYKWKI